MENELNVESVTPETPVQSAEPAETSSNTYTSKERNWYLIGMAGQNIIYNIIGAALAYYLQFTLLIPALAVTAIMTAARVWDAFNDPIMGTLVDRTRTKWGKCRPYLMIVPIPIMLITIACFYNFGFYGEGIVPDSLIVGWAAFTYILWGMTYTIGDIPLWGVTAVMTDSDKQRNKLLSLARIFAGFGGGITLLAMQPLSLALGGVMAGSTGSAAMGEKYGFLVAAAIFALFGTLMFQPLGFKIKERIKPSPVKQSLLANLKIACKNKPFRQIMISGLLGSTKMLIALAAMPLITYYFSSKSPILALVYMVLLGGGFFLGQFISMAFTPKLLTKFSTKKLYNGSNLLSVFPFLFIFFAYLIDPTGLTSWYWIVVCFVLFGVCGIANGITTVLQSTMIASAVDYEEYTTGTRPDAAFFAGQTFITKLQSGIATAISGIAYTIVHFSDARVGELNAFIEAGGTPRLMDEYSGFMMILFLIVSIPPAIGCILSVIPTWKYALDDKEHHRIVEELKLRRAAALAASTSVATNADGTVITPSDVDGNALTENAPDSNQTDAPNDADITENAEGLPPETEDTGSEIKEDKQE